MSEEIEKIYSKLIALETVVSDLRQGYLIVNQRYTNALASLKELTAHASEAAKRSAASALKAAEAAKNASLAAAEAAAIPVLTAADAAAVAAAHAAEAAIEAAASAASAAAAAAAAVAHQAEESSLIASAQAAEATKEVLQSAETKELFERIFIEVDFKQGEEFIRYLSTTSAVYAEVIRKNNIKLEV